jgi:4'-phosphopantetheinyl transferase
LWLLDGRCVHDDDLDFFAQRLSPSESHRYARFVRRQRQRQFLLGRALLRIAAATVTGLPSDAFHVMEHPGDAPQLTLVAEACLIPYFSLSHSNDWIACVVSSNARVGIDIEFTDLARDVLASSRIAFHPEEHVWLLRQPGSVQLSAFYELWCSREALYKLHSALKLERDSVPLITPDGRIADTGCGWRRYSLPRSALTVVICSDRKLEAIEQVDLDGLARKDWL